MADASRGSQQLPVESKIMKAPFEPVPILEKKLRGSQTTNPGLRMLTSTDVPCQGISERLRTSTDRE
jgi:hypothetical protein